MRYKKGEHLPPRAISPKRWGFDREKGWRHEVSPEFRQAYTDSRLEQYQREYGPLHQEDLDWLESPTQFVPPELLDWAEEEADSEDYSDIDLDEHAKLRREALVKAQEAKDFLEAETEEARIHRLFAELVAS